MPHANCPYSASGLSFFSIKTVFIDNIMQVEHKNMTPSAALEYVRSRRPRVLLAPSQWKVRWTPTC